MVHATTRTSRILLWLVLASAAAGCQASSVLPPTSNPTSPGPVPSGPVVSIVGNWVGTLESANFETATINMVVVQFADCVDGSWRSSTGWTGAISGFAATDSFSGQISFERPSIGGDGGCLATGTVTGPVGSDDLRWTTATLTPVGRCAGELPRSIVFSMRRQ